MALSLMTRMDTPSMSSATSFIANLPNEILGEVLSYLPMTDMVEWKNSAGRGIKAAQFTVLLQVSRVFRTIAMASDAILDWQFNFASLSPIIPGSNNSLDPWAIFSDKRLGSFAANEYLVRALARKREWTVRQPIDVFLTLLGGFPTRHQSIQKLSIVQIPREPAPTSQPLIAFDLPAFAEFALKHLSTCQHVVELAVEPGVSEPLNLNLISNGFPNLKYLKIIMTGADLEGSLEALTRLESLEFTTVRDLCPDFESDMLPWWSAESLTSLSLTNVTVDIDEFELWRARKLRHFTHLNCKAKGLFWAHPRITDCLRFLDSPFLETYECYTRPPEFPILHPCLSRLQALTIRTVPPSGNTLDTQFITNWMDLLVEITLQVHHLKDILFVNVGMDVGHLQCLSRLHSLKSITWLFERDFCQILGEGTPEEALAKVFQSFATKPKIKVIWNGDFLYGQSSRWPDHS
jgi:hypothetical protein